MTAVAPARDLLREPGVLLPAGEVALPDPRIFSNASDVAEAGFVRWLHWSNAARHVAQPAVVLGYYETGTVLDGSSPFHVLAGGVLVAEQFFDDPAAAPAAAASLAARGATAHTVERPCLLACHRGLWTWGHWLLDTLPKIVLAERAQPKLFTYAVPADLFEDASRPNFVRAVIDSLAAYGIDPARCLRIRSGQAYRFASLFDVADAAAYPVHHSLRQMHPGVIAAMRDIPHAPPAGRTAFTVLLRGEGGERALANRSEIVTVLRQAGARFIDPATASFAEQVAAVRDSNLIAADLGSNLATLIYAAPETCLLSLAPAGWTDSYFVNVAQLSGVRQADIRGRSLPRGGAGNPAKDAYDIDPDAVRRGIDALRAPNRLDARLPLRIDNLPVAPATGAAAIDLTFGAGGSATPYLGEGFADPETEFTWSLGPGCRITLPRVTPKTGDLWLELHGSGHVAPPYLCATELRIRANGTELAHLAIDHLAHLNILIPASVRARQQPLELVFETPVCPSPAALGLSEDRRPLGFAFRRLTLRRPAASIAATLSVAKRK